jgi:zinc carboxypeptidase
MRFFILSILLISGSLSAQKNAKYETFFEKGNGNQSATYAETIQYYQLLADDFASVEIREMGTTDSGEPLHIVTYNPDANFNFENIRKNKAVILINNGIHAGEPDGIDATMLLFRDLALGKIKIPKNAVVVTIPVYNIGGALNRNSTSRVNQEGPEIYGFRGNARNYDLNRDFIKADVKNTRSFIDIFHLTQPDIFIDNHVSNGADYQYTLTYIMTQPDKLGKPLGNYFRSAMMPALIKDLQRKKIEMTPYVNVWHGPPDQGFQQFFESPRYATGYTALFNTIGFVVETHMLKKYDLRVKATYDFMQEAVDYVDKDFVKIKQLRVENAAEYTVGEEYPVRWAIDSSKARTITFLGYEGRYKKSDATTGNRLFYDRKKPYKKDIPYFDTYKPTVQIRIPNAYVIPQGYWHVVDLLKQNHVAFRQIKSDTLIAVESYHIADYKTASNAYEGHYPHRDTKITAATAEIPFRKGDYIFPTQQDAMKYLLETLEPEAVDSFFNWNFFDTILQQKEGYSDYVFEDLAARLLRDDPKLKAALEQKKRDDQKFASTPEAQLEWIYRNSVYCEKAHLQYPVYRIMK